MSKIYHIPVNFNQSGYVFNGLIETRKAVEAVGGALLGYFICKLLPLPAGPVSISIYVFVCLILALVGFVGIQGEPITTYLLYRHRWKKIRKKPFVYNPNGEAFSMTTAQVILEEPAVQDALADAWENVTAKFRPKETELIPGKTFSFAEDPLVAKMKQAEEQRRLQDTDQDTPSEELPAVDLDMSDILDEALVEPKKGGRRSGKKK